MLSGTRNIASGLQLKKFITDKNLMSVDWHLSDHHKYFHFTYSRGTKSVKKPDKLRIPWYTNRYVL